ncbi:Neurogenic locus Notch protein [Schistosoma japonicum]|nr:Neurogenic locus Notch protein [Schistosoma japonicum]
MDACNIQYAKLYIPHNPCELNPCQNGAQCVNIQNWSRKLSINKFDTLVDYFCVCLKGWTGQNCTDDIDDCVMQPCRNGGICEDKPNMRFYCHCPIEFVGQTCEYRNPCQFSPCLNGGACYSDPFGQFTCICPQWYSGVRCEKEINPCYPTSPCLGKHSTCHLLTSKNRTVSGPSFSIHKSEYIVDFICQCGPDYFGRYCDKKQNLCMKNNCQNGATCLQNGSHYDCLCPLGFTGPICNIPIDVSKYTHSDVNILIESHKVEINETNNNSTESFNLFGDYCYQLGCSDARAGDNICQAKCIYAKCLDAEEELQKDCQHWLECLRVTDHSVNQYNMTTCVEQFKNGKCQHECNRSECYLDGLDCFQSILSCAPFDFCRQSYGDGVCHVQCNTVQCGYDGGDCNVIHENKNLSSKYILFNLRTNQSQFLLNRSHFLGNLGILLQSIVNIAKDNVTEDLLIEDIPSKNQIKLLLKVMSPKFQLHINCNPNEEISCSNFSVSLFKTNELKNYILAALSTFQYKSPFDIIYLNFVDSPSQSHFKALLEADSLTVTKISNEAIGLYTCICILAGILFLVFQRDNNWHKPLKRVKTKGIWCPPIPSIYSKTNQIELLGQQSSLYFPELTSSMTITKPTVTTTINEPKYVDNTFKQNSSTLSFFQSYLNSSTANEKDALLLPNVPKCINENISEFLSDKDELMSNILPNSTNVYTVSKCLDNLFNEGLESFQTFRENEKHSQHDYKLNLENKDNLTSIENESLHFNEQNTINTYNNETKMKTNESYQEDVIKMISSLDGLHPCNVMQQHQIEQILNDYSIKEYSDDDLSKNLLRDQSLLHVAAHMNAGCDVINKICRSRHNQAPLGVLYVDSLGRTALTNAAAANSLESVKSLYQLEKEALVNKKSTKSVKLHHIIKPKSNYRSRRRNQIYESRQCSPIIAAIQGGNDEIVKYLLDDGCLYNTVDQYGRNAVHWAAVTNSVKTLSRLSQCKGFARLMNMKDDWDRTPIMLAIREGCQEAVEFLLDKQAKIEIIDCMENDCLSLCIEKGYERMYELLMNYMRTKSSETKSLTRDKTVNIFDDNPVITKQGIALTPILMSTQCETPVTTLISTTSAQNSTDNICRVNTFDWVSLSDNSISEEFIDYDQITEDINEDCTVNVKK